MAQWEYLTIFVEARATDKQMKHFIRENFDKKARKHSPESMIPELNDLGRDGWEMIHMEPLPRVGGKEDVLFDTNNWSSTYFCVFKRELSDGDLPLMMGTQTQQTAPDNPTETSSSDD
jgi:hypothetical protein